MRETPREDAVIHSESKCSPPSVQDVTRLNVGKEAWVGQRDPTDALPQCDPQFSSVVTHWARRHLSTC